MKNTNEKQFHTHAVPVMQWPGQLMSWTYAEALDLALKYIAIEEVYDGGIGQHSTFVPMEGI